jgi:diacylglycerol kinase family enzyme
MRIYVVFNPVAGRKNLRDVEAVLRKELEKGLKNFDVREGLSVSDNTDDSKRVIWYETQAVSKQKYEGLLDGEFDRIVVVGGDGSVTELVSFLIEHGLKIPLVLIPQGSGNLLAHSLGVFLLPLKKQIGLAFNGKVKEVDALRVNGHLAMVAVGRGYDTLLVSETSRRSKRIWGLMAYGWAALKTILFYRSGIYKVRLDEKRFQVRAKMILVVNTLPFLNSILAQWLLGKKLSPHDGELNLFVCKRWFKWDFYSGKSVVIKAKHQRRFQSDGEIFKASTLNVEVLARAVEICG